MPKRRTHIPVRHAVTGAAWDCPAKYLGRALAKGFEVIDPDDVTNVEPAAGFNPADHNVDEVNDHLAEADPDEVERVLALERAGKDRSTIAAPQGESTVNGD